MLLMHPTKAILSCMLLMHPAKALLRWALEHPCCSLHRLLLLPLQKARQEALPRPRPLGWTPLAIVPVAYEHIVWVHECSAMLWRGHGKDVHGVLHAERALAKGAWLHTFAKFKSKMRPPPRERVHPTPDCCRRP